MPSTCTSSDSLPNNLLYFSSWVDITVTFVQTHSTNLSCLYPNIWEVQITENGITSTAYLAQLSSSLGGCAFDLASCGRTRVAIPKPNPYDFVEIDFDALRDTCINQLIADATQAALNTYQTYVDSLLTEYFASVQNCWNNPFNESFTVTYDQSEYHHTLYYYDQAGNLVQTIPPAGVRMLDASHFDANGVWDNTEPQHILPTRYQYNSIGQIVKQTSPDAGLATFYFDDVQRLRLSQNAQQALNNQYSFIAYDDQARIARSGQINNYNVSNTQLYADINDLAFPYSYGVLAYSLDQVTSTSYDFPINPNPNFPQYNLRGRVATIQNDNIITYYSYDILGNVHTLYQDVVGFKSFKTEYKYDLITSKVNQVAYQPGQVDALFHQYSYDADLRLNRVVSATVAWQAFAQDNHYQLLNPSAEARYFYHTHGPLARTEIGEQVAGNDFRYSLQGWIMGVNNVQDATELPRRDAGVDGFFNADEDFGSPTHLNRWMARDEFAYALGYHDQAYTPIGTNVNLGHASVWSDMSADILGIGSNLGLFNGNIAHMLVAINRLEKQQTGTGLVGFAYQYDQLHRIKQSRDYRSLSSSKWQPNYTANTNYSYDPNGNITQLSRIAPIGGATLIDDFTYNYNLNSNGDLINNRLNYIADQAGGFPIGDLPSQSNNNYVYNAIGQLTQDVSQGISNVVWNIQAKVDRVDFNNAKPTVYYTYDALGNRLTKKVNNVTTYYIRDAQGNTLAAYEQNGSNTNLTEQHLYGSARIGMRQTNLLVKNTAGIVSLNPNQRVFYRSVGHKAYEQCNHLGDVLVTLSDKVLNQGGYYQAIVKNASLTYPFGWAIPERTYTSASGDYRFGFNGQEIDKEWGGDVAAFKYRFEDLRICRFFAVDPITAEYPELTPYQVASNSPIYMVELEGLEGSDIHTSITAKELYNPKLSIDMTQAGATEKSINGNLQYATSYTKQGAPRNHLYYWNTALRNNPEMFSEANRAMISNGAAPEVDPQWVQFNPTHKQYMNQKLIHHHIYQGKYATAIPVTAHNEFSAVLHPFNPGSKYTTKLKNKFGNSMLAFGFVGDAAGFATGNPDNVASMFDNRIQPGILKRDWANSNLYYMVSEMSEYTNDGDNWKGADFYIYSSFSWNSELKKYVGEGLIGRGEKYESEYGDYIFKVFDNKENIKIYDSYYNHSAKRMR